MFAGSHLPNARLQREGLTSSRSDLAKGYLFVILAQLLGAIMDLVQLGYEDENGFHLGTGSGSM